MLIQHKQIKSIQGLRGIAASLVCIMHIVSDQPSSDQWIIVIQKIMQSIGHFGVDLFFTISGFIITWIMMKEGELPSVKRGFGFVIKRIFRIYPLFWFTLIFMFCLSIFNNGFITDEARQALGYSVIFLLTPKIPLQYSAWTLCFELYFYVVVFFFMCVCRRQYFIYFFTIWALFHFLMLTLNTYHLLNPSFAVLGHYQILEFYFGLLVGFCLFYFNWNITTQYAAIGIGLILFFIHAVMVYKGISVSTWIALLLHGGAAGLFLYGVVGLEQHNCLEVPKILQGLGDISYSIYLWAFPILGVMTHIDHRFVFWGDILPLFRGFIVILIVFMISYASFRWIETPFINSSRRLSIIFS